MIHTPQPLAHAVSMEPFGVLIRGMGFEAVHLPTSVPLHIPPSATGMAGLTGLVILSSGLVSSVLACLGVVTFVKRRSRAYMFVAFALVTLAAKALVGSIAMLNFVSYATHHLIEHAFDLVISVFLIAAVYEGRTDGGNTDTIDDERDRSSSKSR